MSEAHVLFGRRCSQFIWSAGIILIVVLAKPSYSRDTHLSSDARVVLLSSSGFEEPLVPIGRTSSEEDTALEEAIASYRKNGNEENLQIFELFLSRYPSSAWRVALLTNLGLSYYHYGYFSRAIDAWEQAWQAGSAVSDPRAKALVDRAVGELARMHARLGHANRLQELFEEIDHRPITGPATETLAGAREGLWTMRNNAGVAYLCGPMALKNLLLSQGYTHNQVEFLDEYRSGPAGVSLAEVARLASQAKMTHSLIFRSVDQPVPVPSIIHWKVSHFAAVIGEENGRFHIIDPTFGRDLLMTRNAIDSESSGYFLLRDDDMAGIWRSVSLIEASQVRGMGYTGSNDPNATTPDDSMAHTCNCGQDSSSTTAAPNYGMAAYNIHEMVDSLHITDTPIGYAPPVGPSVYVTLTYNQREATQPANFTYFNVSPKWTMNWLTYVQDDPNNIGANVSRYVAGGGAVDYSGYNNNTQTFTPEVRNAAVLALVSTDPIIYQRQLNDGSQEIYQYSNGSTNYPRLVFLTKIIDRAGNSVSLTYDKQIRLTTITDALGQKTKLSYALSSQPLLVTQITDPFGRKAAIAYDSQGHLSQITDVIGLNSQFGYDSSYLVNVMTTPYGVTHFEYGNGLDGNSRYLQITDPLGFAEREEYVQGAPGVPFSDPPNTVPQGIIAPFNAYLNDRDSFYWDKHAFQIASGNYSYARTKHFSHLLTNTNITSSQVESIKFPLENRIWLNYPGQDFGGDSGTYGGPSRIGRVLDDGSTQLVQITYNASGNRSEIIDPVGRDTLLSYDPSGIDLLQTQRNSSSGFVTVTTFTYNTQHFPLTYTDAAGQVTSYTYNQAGQLRTATNALGEVTKYDYDKLGNLIDIVNPNNKVAEKFTYDRVKRIASRTDSEGFAINYRYDALDRITQEQYPDSTTRQFTWDKLDLVAVKDREGRITRYRYDAARNLIDITDPLGNHKRFAYYENGRLKSFTDSNKNVTKWDIDVEGRVTATHYADHSKAENTYEFATSRLKAVSDALGQVKQYTYTVDDRLAGIDYFKAINATPSVRFSYDPYFELLTSMSDGFGTSQYQYVQVGSLGALQLGQENSSHNNDTIGYQYDALGRLIVRTVDSSVEKLTFDSLGRPTSHQTPLGTFNLSYLGQTFQLTTQQVNSGTVSTKWSYETNLLDRRLKAIKNSGLTRSFHYTSTAEYDITQVRESGSAASTSRVQTWDYGYDKADRLLTADSSLGQQYAYQYDVVGNVTQFQTPSGIEDATYNDVNEIVSFGNRSFSYDADGNLIDDGVRNYQWDAENRLIGVVYDTDHTRSSLFRYDGLGRRVDIVATNARVSVENVYLWCGITLCQQETANGTVSRKYFREGEVIAGADTPLYYASDQLGSVRDVLSLHDGSRVESYDYDSYGNLTYRLGHTTTNFRYAGMFYEPNSELYLTQYRAYDPVTGRWLSRDPLQGTAGAGNNMLMASASGYNIPNFTVHGLNNVDSAGMPMVTTNSYEYTLDDPVNLVDRRGQFAIPAVIVGAGVLIAEYCVFHPEVCNEVASSALEWATGQTTGAPPETGPGWAIWAVQTAVECADKIPFGAPPPSPPYPSIGPGSPDDQPYIEPPVMFNPYEFGPYQP
jgi:RHS repeat-associated protein